MSEEEFGGLGGDEAEGAGEADQGSAGLDAAAAALAMQQAARSGGLHPAAIEYFRRQSRFVATQTEHLHEQRALVLSNLRLRRIGGLIRLTTQAGVLLATTALLALGGIVLHDAFNSQSLVVEQFETAPGLAARGLSGRVVASTVLDQLTRLQANTFAEAAKRDLAGAWTHEIRAELPESGVSLAELATLLRNRFGSDTHISGDLVQAEGGQLELTVRGEGIVPARFTGPANALNDLTQQAAEYIYGQTQPALYAEYLLDVARAKDAEAFVQRVIPHASLAERPYLLVAWANAYQQLRMPGGDQLPLLKAALALKPDYWRAWMNIALTQLFDQREEDAIETFTAMQAKAGGRPGRADEIYYFVFDQMMHDFSREAQAIQADLDAHTGHGTIIFPFTLRMAELALERHDLAEAELRLRSDHPDHDEWVFDAERLKVQIMLALEQGAAPRDALRVVPGYTVQSVASALQSTAYFGACWLAPVLQQAGEAELADQVLAALPHVTQCQSYRGDVEDLRGDWAAAQRSYARAVAIGPDLPDGYYEWAAAFARHHDDAGALEKLAAANARSPHWAEPLKLWGDILVRQGKRREALEKYDAALAYAPAWPALLQARKATAGQS